jgi:glyoxylase-like metal-dependent hydrolase (beta-lactamase superfamily II)
MSLEVITFVNGKWFQNCYIMFDQDNDAIIIDPGSRPEDIAALVEKNHWRIHAIVNTHAHYDHIGAVAGLKERYEVPFYLHGADEHLLKRANLYRMLFESREAVRIPTITHDISRLPATFEVGPFAISWIATPGHTEGSVCLLCKGFLFSGDTLMHNSVGRTDLPGGNRDQLHASVRKLMALPRETVVCGGHGPRTTLQVEFAPGARVRSLVQ